MRDQSIAFGAPPLAYLDADQLTRLHRASLKVMAHIGCRVNHDAALQQLRTNGAKVASDGFVRIPGRLVDRALSQAPASITLFDRTGRAAMELIGTNVYYGTGSDCHYWLDPATQTIRAFLSRDLIDAYKVADALAYIDFVMGMGVAADLKGPDSFQQKYALLLRHTSKPHVLISGPEVDVLEDMVAMAAAVVGGFETLVAKPIMALLVDPTSPLVHSEDALAKLMYMAKQRLPVVYAPGIMAGATGPITMAGAVVQANAEILTGLVIHQLCSSGAPFIFGAGMSPMDMKSAQPTYAAPEAMICQAALSQLGRSLYHLPTWGFGGCSASKCCDAQAVSEAATYLQTSAWMGTNLVHDIGYIESGMTYSLELLVLCNEFIGQIRRLMDGLDLDDTQLALDAIQRVGPGGSFLADPHTLQHFKANWQPDLTDRSTRQTWEKKGRKSMNERAREKIKGILASHQAPALTSDARVALDEMLKQRKPN
jgi:trimethylamine--corrinoid protein Co-methyltransferase